VRPVLLHLSPHGRLLALSLNARTPHLDAVLIASADLGQWHVSAGGISCSAGILAVAGSAADGALSLWNLAGLGDDVADGPAADGESEKSAPQQQQQQQQPDSAAAATMRVGAAPPCDEDALASRLVAYLGRKPAERRLSAGVRVIRYVSGLGLAAPGFLRAVVEGGASREIGVAVSPQGRRVAVLDHEGTVTVYRSSDITDGMVIAVAPAPQDPGKPSSAARGSADGSRKSANKGGGGAGGGGAGGGAPRGSTLLSPLDDEDDDASSLASNAAADPGAFARQRVVAVRWFTDHALLTVSDAGELHLRTLAAPDAQLIRPPPGPFPGLPSVSVVPGSGRVVIAYPRRDTLAGPSAAGVAEYAGRGDGGVRSLADLVAKWLGRGPYPAVGAAVGTLASYIDGGGDGGSVDELGVTVLSQTSRKRIVMRFIRAGDWDAVRDAMDADSDDSNDDDDCSSSSSSSRGSSRGSSDEDDDAGNVPDEKGGATGSPSLAVSTSSAARAAGGWRARVRWMLGVRTGPVTRALLAESLDRIAGLPFVLCQCVDTRVASLAEARLLLEYGLSRCVPARPETWDPAGDGTAEAGGGRFECVIFSQLFFIFFFFFFVKPVSLGLTLLLYSPLQCSYRDHPATGVTPCRASASASVRGHALDTRRCALVAVTARCRGPGLAAVVADSAPHRTARVARICV
jgi:hypothetical protein